MVFGRSKKKDEEEEQYKKEMALTEEGRPATDQNYLDALGKIYYMVKDDQEAALLWSKKELRNLIPAFSALNQLSNIDDKEARIRRLKYKILLLKMKGYMNAKKYAEGGSTLISSLELRSRSIVSDSKGGWKGRIITESSKVTRHVFEKEKKGLLR